MQYTYHLARYAGKASRLTCPACERPHCFSPYVNEAGEVLDPTVGRCDHESSCSYHKTPADYFREHPEARQPDWRYACHPERSEGSRPVILSAAKDLYRHPLRVRKPRYTRYSSS